MTTDLSRRLEAAWASARAATEAYNELLTDTEIATDGPAAELGAELTALEESLRALTLDLLTPAGS